MRSWRVLQRKVRLHRRCLASQDPARNLPVKSGPHERLVQCERSNQWQQALHILADLILLRNLVGGPRADLHAYNLTLGACAGQQLWETTLDLFYRMTTCGPAPDLIALSAVVDACARASKQKQAVRLQQTWSEPCHKITAWEIFRVVRKTRSLTQVPAPRASYFNMGSLVNRSLWAEALTLFWRLARSSEIQVTAKLLNMGLVACQRGHRSTDALLLLRTAERQHSQQLPEPDLESYYITMRALGDAGARSAELGTAEHRRTPHASWRGAVQLLEDLRKRRLEPSTRTYNTLASACSRGHAWVQASRFLNLAVDQGLPWDLFSYNIAIQVSHRSAGGSSLMMLLSQLQRQGLEPNGVTFTAAIGACERAGRWELALDFLRRLRQVSPVGAITSNSVMAACATGHAWAEAVKVFWDMLLAGTADAASLSNVLKAFRTTSQWQKACWHLFEVPSAFQLAASWHHYVSVAEACSLQSSWQQALWLLFHAAPPTDAADYRFSAAISACKNALVAGGVQTAASDQLWQLAVALYEESREQDDPDVPAADGEFGAGGALISVFEKMAMWQSALQVFSQIQEPNRVDYVTTLLAVAGHAPEIAKDLYLQSPLPAQALRPLDTPGPGMTLDLHDMPVEVATLAVEVLLEDIDAGSQLVILTGHAQHRSVPGRVRQAVLSLLKTRPDVEVQEPEENQGMLICGIKR